MAFEQLIAASQNKIDLGQAAVQSANTGLGITSSFRQMDSTMLAARQQAVAENSIAFEQAVRAGKAAGEGEQRRIDNAAREAAGLAQAEQTRINQQQADLRRQELGMRGAQFDQTFREGQRQQSFVEGQYEDERGDIEQRRQYLQDLSRGTPRSTQGIDFDPGKTKVKGDFSDITPADLTPHLSKSLGNHAQDFVDAGKEFGLDPRFLASIAKFETGNGSSSAFLNKNNALGVSSPKGPTSFNNVRESIRAQAKSLSRKGGFYDGKDTIAGIGSVYAPPGAGNDPNGTNRLWPESVGKFYSTMLGGSGRAPLPDAPNAPPAPGGQLTEEDIAIQEQEARETPTGTHPEDPVLDEEYIKSIPPVERVPFRKQAKAELAGLKVLEEEITFKEEELSIIGEELEARVEQSKAINKELAGAAIASPDLVLQQRELRQQKIQLAKQKTDLRRQKARADEKLAVTKPEFETLTQSERELAVRTVEIASRISDVRENFENLDPDEQGRLQGQVTTVLDKGIENLDYATFIASVISALPGLAREVFGEVGVLTDKDMERYRKLLPDITDSADIGEVLISTLEDIITDRANSVVYTSELAGADTAEIIAMLEAEGFDMNRVKPGLTAAQVNKNIEIAEKAYQKALEAVKSGEDTAARTTPGGLIFQYNVEAGRAFQVPQ